MSEKRTFGERLIARAEEALAIKRGEKRPARVSRRKVTARQAVVVPPPVYDAARVQRVRERLGLSQPVFAALVGATPAAVKAWEQGRRNPPGPARRLLEIAERNPDVFEKDIRRAG